MSNTNEEGWVEGMEDFYMSFDDVWSRMFVMRSEEHTSELQSRLHLVCRLLLEKKKTTTNKKKKNNKMRDEEQEYM